MLASLDRASQGMAVLEAADQLALEREPNPQLYRMVVGVLRTIAERPSPLVVPAFYWKLLAAEGLRPSSTRACAAARTATTTPLVAFDLDEGGVLCRIVPLRRRRSRRGALALLRAILGGRLNDALATAESPATHEVAALATKALEHHIERRLRAVAMFER